MSRSVSVVSSAHTSLRGGARRIATAARRIHEPGETHRPGALGHQSIERALGVLRRVYATNATCVDVVDRADLGALDDADWGQVVRTTRFDCAPSAPPRPAAWSR